MFDISDAITEALVLMIVAAILGGIIVWLLMRSRYAMLKGDYDELDKKHADLEHRFNVQGNELTDLRTQYEALEAQLKACTSQRAELNSQITLLTPFRTKFEQLEKDYADLQAKGSGSASGASAPSYPDLSGRVKELEAEIAGLKGNLDTASKEVAAAESKAKKAKESEEAILARIRAKAGDINFDRIGVATADEKDPLQRVKGIGPFIEKKLNSIGIFTFRQIAAFNEEDETTVNKAIEFFPGRIKRDKWSDQAAAFEKEKEENKG